MNKLKAIQATPQSLSEIFQKEFEIPDFQRPYNWEEGHCEQLWEDLIGHYERSSEENYFLGPLVVYLEGSRYSVIDGQQRLTTLLILTKALLENATGDAANLARHLLYYFDKGANQFDEEKPKIESKVLQNDDCNQLSNLLKEPSEAEGRAKQNYDFFDKKIKEYLQDDNNKENFTQFLKMMGDNVVLLPIQCEDFEHALTIFDTVNNRGLNLSDIDIFKAKLYRQAYKKGEAAIKEFTKRWSGLGTEEWNKEWYFKYYMRVLRGQNKIKGNEIALRSFFKNRLEDYQKVLADFDHIQACYDYLWTTCQKEPEVYNLLITLWVDSKDSSDYLIYSFLFKHLPRKEEPELSEADFSKFKELLRAMCAFVYSTSIVHAPIKLKSDVFSFNVDLAEGNTDKVIASMKEKAKGLAEKAMNSLNANFLNWYRPSLLKGILYLLAAINSGQKALLRERMQREHILPKKAFNHYDGWSEEAYSKHLHSLGNAVLLEKQLNITASNEFFAKKKLEYKKSVVSEAKKLCKLEAWTPEALKKRQKEKTKILLQFFKQA